MVLIILADTHVVSEADNVGSRQGAHAIASAKSSASTRPGVYQEEQWENEHLRNKLVVIVSCESERTISSVWRLSSECADLSLRAVNLGESGFFLCRLHPDDKMGGAHRWQVVHETPNQSHYFNCPYQLGFGESGDKPDMGDEYELETQEGDVIVLGTDGLFDILFADQIARLLDTVLPFTPVFDAYSMEKVASCIAHTAHNAAKGLNSQRQI
ncbi:hypothetical protein PsorP6_017049 [Peronosclerospora sorghi]|uniref:Uncharacterized protein n=1 Tax=Peronosclerospora sorghi TaxID=230839 RepID=A0ACC0WD56_9STRA|nr:hypothetical protein PsorP6_017049 [Peronosclerospora sorghi]